MFRHERVAAEDVWIAGGLRKSFCLPQKLGLSVIAALIAICVSARADSLYISYANTDDVVEQFQSAGVSGQVTDAGAFTTTNVDTPNGIAFDSSGNLYVANDTSNTVSEFSANGAYLGVVISGLNQPAGIAIDQFGNVYVASNAGGSIIELQPGGQPFVYASGLNGPNGIAFGPNGNLYVACGSNDAIVEIGSSGQQVFASANQIGNGPAGVGFTALSQPMDIAFDASGNLYVTNFGNDTIQEFSSTGTAFASSFASNGDPSNPTNAEAIWNPVGLAFDSSGDLFVANYHHTGTEGNGYSYVDEYSSTGTLITAFTDSNNPPVLRDASYIAIEGSNGQPLLAIPEPASMAYFGLGSMIIAGWTWMRRRR
jgi:sugar lactone lactonase YvrE